MDIRPLTDYLSVSPQIALEDMPAIAAAGFGTVICNRPDSEVLPALHATRMAEAAEAAGLTFVINPAVHSGMTADLIERQKRAIEASQKPVLAYCQSGTRCTVIWMLSEAATTPADDLIDIAAKAGYPLHALKPQLEAQRQG